METASETNKRFATQLPGNLISNIAYFLLHIAIGILLVPYFISSLGIAAYGLIPLVSAVMGYVAVVIQSLDTSVSRFLTIDLQKNDYRAANQTFNTAFFGLCLIITLMIPIFIIVAHFVPIIFNVPAGQETSTIILFLCASIAFFIRSLNGTYTVQLFAYNRLDLMNLVNIVNYVVQVGLIVLLFWLKGPSLECIGGAYIGGAIAASAVAVILAKRVCPFLHLSFGSFDRSRVRELGMTGGWLLIDQIGALLLLQIDLMVVNIFFGATSAGEYAIVYQWENQLRTIAVVLASVLTPMVLTYYAREQTEAMIRVMKSAVKIMGLTLALPIGLVCGFAPQILTIWVGEKYAFLAPLMILLTGHLIVNRAVLPIFSVNIAYNKVSVPGIMTLIAGITNLILAVILVLFTGLGLYAVAISGAIVLTLKDAVFNPWYTARVLGVSVRTFLAPVLPGAVACILLGISAVVLGSVLPLNTILPLILVCGGIAAVYSIMIWRIGLSGSERKLFGSFLPEKIRTFFV
jgi:O-antigen/teichoic acid export membrane protein